MKKKKLTFFTAIVLVFSAIYVLSAAPADAIVSLVSPVKQEKSFWCWAATSQALIKKVKGNSNAPSQTNFVIYTLGYSTAPNIWATTAQMRSGMSNWNVTTTYTATSLNFSSVQVQIASNKKPFILIWDWTNGSLGSHAVVVNGYSTASGTDMISYWDPKDGKYYAENYSKFVLGSDRKWSETIYNPR